MKKTLVIMLAALGLIFAAPAAAQDKDIAKIYKKEIKQRKSAMKKNKQQLFGTSRGIDVALLNHYLAVDAGSQEIPGYAHAKSKNLLTIAAQNSVAARYAAQASAQIKGMLKQELEGDAENVDNEVDKISATYLTKVEAEMKGILKPSYSLISVAPDGAWDLEAWYLVNPENATNARRNALKQALKEHNREMPEEKTAVIVQQTVVIAQQ